jgi:hypothetical protein
MGFSGLDDRDRAHRLLRSNRLQLLAVFGPGLQAVENQNAATNARGHQQAFDHECGLG